MAKLENRLSAESCERLGQQVNTEVSPGGSVMDVHCTYLDETTDGYSLCNYPREKIKPELLKACSSYPRCSLLSKFPYRFSGFPCSNNNDCNVTTKTDRTGKIVDVTCPQIIKQYSPDKREVIYSDCRTSAGLACKLLRLNDLS